MFTVTASKSGGSIALTVRHNPQSISWIVTRCYEDFEQLDAAAQAAAIPAPHLPTALAASASISLLAGYCNELLGESAALAHPAVGDFFDFERGLCGASFRGDKVRPTSLFCSPPK